MSVRARLVKYLKRCEVGQVEAAPRLELAELVQLLRHLEVGVLSSATKSATTWQNHASEKRRCFLTCLVPPIALELFFRYLVMVEMMVMVIHRMVLRTSDVGGRFR